MAENDLVQSPLTAWKDFTGQTSTLVRNLALSALALIWLLSGGLGPKAGTPQEILELLRAEDALWFSFRCALAALTADILQYAVSSALWGAYSWTTASLRDPAPGETAEYKLAYGLGSVFGITQHLVERLQVGGDASAKPSELRRVILSDALRADVADAFSEPLVPSLVTFPGLVFFWTKTILLAACYTTLLLHLF